MKTYISDDAVLQTSELRKTFARKMLNPTWGGFDVGIRLGFFARHFGARVPVQQIALIYESIWTTYELLNFI
jgi:hypothetical protein